jgi:bifunctional oligoribonuclease and PAP phosphatase NrnA
MSSVDLGQALELIRAHDSFLVTSHTGPDGDALGCILGMRCLLESLGKVNIVCALHDPVPRMYRWMTGADEVQSPDDLRKSAFDLVIVLDVAQLDRIGSVRDAFNSDQTILILDHHLEQRPEGTHNLIAPEYSSASEIVADLFQLAGIGYSRTAAECVYVGLSTDTGGFRYANTNPDSHRRAVDMLSAGIDVAAISSRVFDTMSRPKKELLQRVLDRMRFVAGDTVAYSYLYLRDLEETEALPEDVDGLVNYARNVEGTIVGILFREDDRGRIKISMRSTGLLNAADVLREFGGGGHAGAAGGTVEGNLDTVLADVVRRIEERLADSAAVQAHG